MLNVITCDDRLNTAEAARAAASPVGEVPLKTLEGQLTTLAGHVGAAEYRFLVLLEEFERREGHAGMGIASCAHWLSWRCGIGLVAAREKCRVAKALVGLPLVSDAMRQGTISYCKVRALTRVATPENERVLLKVAMCGTVSHVERTVRLYRRDRLARELEGTHQQQAERYLQYYVDTDGMVVIRGRLPAEQGAQVMTALGAAEDALREAERDSRESPAAPDRPRDGHEARRADALALMAETFLAKGAAPLAAGERHVVTVHVDEQVLRDELAEGRCDINGVAVPSATIRRLCCDGSLVALVHDEEGNPVQAGRKTRAISPAMRRALEARDVGCRYPGCTNTRFTDGHHIHHWVEGGETTLDNLILLCRRHHRYLHEHGYTIERSASELRFIRPDGQVVRDAPIPTPRCSERAVAELIEMHEQQGLDIDENTTTPDWFGERADYDWIIGLLQARDDEDSLRDETR